MPSFQPPLSYVSTVHIPPSASDQTYAHLTFLATFNHNEDASGTWEIWTDLPVVDQGGTVTSEPGSWRGLAFSSVDIGKALVNSHPTDGHPVSDKNGPIIQLESSLSPEPVKEDVTRMSLSVSIPAQASQHFAYTYRRILSSSETHWLGGEGSNGVIHFEEGPLNGKRVGDASWQGEPPDDESVIFGGIALEIKDNDGQEETIIHHIPTAKEISADLLILSGTIPLHATPFYRLSQNPLPRATYLNTPQAIHISSPSTSLVIPSGQMVPNAAGMNNVKYFDNDGLLASVLGKALDAAGKSAKFVQSPVVSEGKEVEDVICLFTCLNDGDNSSLILYAPHFFTNREIAVSFPATFQGDYPLALVTKEQNITLLDRSSRTLGVKFSLPPGTIAQSIGIRKFVNISSEPSQKAWICAPLAKRVEKAEADDLKPREDSTTDSNARSGGELAPERDERLDSTTSGDIMPGLFTQEAEEDVDPETEGNPENEMSFFSAIGQFFVNLWKMFCGVFSSSGPDDIAPRDEDDDELEDDDDESEEVVTPPNESTPLLGETVISRATSSAMFSQQSSPAVLQHKSPSTPAFHQVDSTVLATADTTSQTNNSHATIFTFPSSVTPPFRFLLRAQDGTSAEPAKLVFSVKGDGNGSWDNLSVSNVEAGKGLIGLDVGRSGLEASTGKSWDVKIEML